MERSSTTFSAQTFLSLLYANCALSDLGSFTIIDHDLFAVDPRRSCDVGRKIILVVLVENGRSLRARVLGNLGNRPDVEVWGTGLMCATDWNARQECAAGSRTMRPVRCC